MLNLSKILLTPTTALLASAVVFAGVCSTAAADNHDDGYQYSGLSAALGTGVLFFEADEEFNSSLIIEGKVGYDLNDSLTLEGSFGYLPYLDATSDTSERSSTWHLNDSQAYRAAVDLIHHFNTDPARKWDPNVGVTAGAMYYSNTLEDGDHVDAFGGFGAGLGYAINRNWVARSDYRLVVAGQDTEFNHHALVSVGYRFGGSGDTGSTGSGSGVDEKALKTIYFDFDEDKITPDSQQRLEHNADYLKNNPKVEVTVEGHCDERGTQDYNAALGERRANSTKEYLRALGVQPERMRTITYGEDRPADPGHNEEAWAKNRRAECVPK